MKRKPIVCVVPYQPHCFAFGGFEIQMLSAMAAVQAEGYDAKKMDFWSKDNDFDVLHVWGFGVVHWPAVEWAHKCGKRVVMSALLCYPTFRYKVGHFISSRYGIGRMDQKLLDLVDCLTVVNDEQAVTATSILGLPENKVVVIPNIVEEKYFNPPSALMSPIGIVDYVLCVGNVCPRKNQLSLAQACVLAKTPLLIIGDLLPGEDAYGKSLTAFIRDNPSVHWLKKMEPESDMLVAAYRHCAAFALPSLNETQPITLLEASAMQKPLLVANRPYSKQKYYSNALRVNPGSVMDISHGIEHVLADRAKYITPRQIIDECRSKNIGVAYGHLFDRVMDSWPL